MARTFAASARSLRDGGRSQGDSGQSLEKEKRSQRRWAVTREYAADTQEPRSVTRRHAAALRRRPATSPSETLRPPMTQALLVYGCRGSRGNEGIMVRSGWASGAERSLAAPARSQRGGGRSLGDSGQSLEEEKRSQRHWAVTRKDAADTQEPRSVTRRHAAALWPTAPATSPPETLRPPVTQALPVLSAAGAAAEKR
ncbi:hypothetical protein ALCH109712_09465 [Alkalicoccus chagannorensis]